MISNYPELAAIVGGSVPDYRGRFLRHVGGNSAALGVAQGDAIRNITASVDAGGIWIPSHNVTGAITTFSKGAGDGCWEHHGDSSRGYYHDNFRFEASRVVPVAAENRPLNMAVKWLIFVGI